MSKLILRHGDCLVVLGELEPGSIDAVVSDPPYDLLTSGSAGFMGKTWDGTGIAFSREFWRCVFRVLVPGGIVKVFGGTKTFHRMARAAVSEGFDEPYLESWVYSTGFPKSSNVAKFIEKRLGQVREKKRVPFDRENSFMRHGGLNPRPWQDRAMEVGYHEMPGDVPASPESAAQEGKGTALKPAWEPILVFRKPA